MNRFLKWQEYVLFQRMPLAGETMEHRWFFTDGTQEYRECLDALSSGHAAEVVNMVSGLAETWESGNELNAEHIGNEVYCVRRTGVDIEYRIFLKRIPLSVSVGQVATFIPLAVVRRSDSSSYQSYITRAREGSLRPSETDLSEIYDACEAYFKAQIPQMPEPTEEIREFLNALRGFQDKSAHLLRDSIIIYESRSFCEWTRTLNDTQLEVVHDQLYRIVDSISGSSTPQGNQAASFIACVPNTQWREEVWYRFQSSENGWVLFVSYSQDSFDEDIRRQSLRAYPGYILYDNELWLAIQKEQAVSLALSPEEEQIIEEVIRKQEIPIFISGRAGSGKSTMLYYIFSNYWYYLEKFRHKMVFLTYTSTLRENASSQIKRITELLARTSSLDTRGDEKIPVKTTREFLLDLLNATEEQYPLHKYLDFQKFRTLKRKNYSSMLSDDVCWHIIRTYIKGYYPNKLMTPDDYSKIPAKDKTVNEHEFKEAYRLFEWFRDNYEGYWDELDLVRELLTKDELPEYYILFCDEAQDFTRIEFELMFRLSFASRYDFGYETPLVPLVLAGDPLQTINPTGFRPKSLQASLYDMVVRRVRCQVGASHRGYYRELVHNYRSSEDITRLSNLINLVRAVVLARRPEEYGAPQAPWRTVSSNPPGLVPLHRFNTEVAPESFHIIIHPELQDYILSDAEETQLHSTISKLIEEQEPNLWTPLEIKGLEKDNVIVYGFGEVLHKIFESFGNALQNRSGLLSSESLKQIAQLVEQSTDARIKLEYFFSNLYVAITRGINYLYVVDTQQGCEVLWRLLLDEARWQSLLEETCSPESEWASCDNYRGLVPQEQISSKPINPREEALQSRERWDKERDVDAGRRAVSWYRKLEDFRQADIVQAQIYEYELDWRHAAEYYEKAEDLSKAVLCRFRNSEWQEVERLLNQNTVLPRTPLNEWIRTWVNIKQHTERSLATQSVDTQKQWVADDFSLWLSQTEEVLREHAQGIDREKIRFEVKRTLEDVTTRLNKEARIYFHEMLVEQRGKLLEFISPEIKSEMVQRLKNEYWIEKRYRDFIAISERYGKEIEEGRYHIAQAEIRGFPEGLKYLVAQGRYSDAVEFWKNHGETIIEDAIELIDELVQRKDVLKALEISIRNSRPDLVVKVLENGEKFVPRESLVSLIQSLLSETREAAKTPLIITTTIASLKLQSRRETIESLHLCIQANIEAKQMIRMVLDYGVEGFLVEDILSAELTRVNSEYLLKDVRLAGYILNGLSEYISDTQRYGKDIEMFLSKFSKRVYEVSYRAKQEEAQEIIAEIDYLHDIVKFRLASVVSEPRRAAITRDLLKAKDTLKEAIDAHLDATPQRREENRISLQGDKCQYLLQFTRGSFVQPEQDDRAYYFPLPNTSVLIRLLKQERRMLLVNTSTGDTKSYFRFSKESKEEDIWGYGSVRIVGRKATITTDTSSIIVEAVSDSRRQEPRE